MINCDDFLDQWITLEVYTGATEQFIYNIDNHLKNIVGIKHGCTKYQGSCD